MICHIVTNGKQADRNTICLLSVSSYYFDGLNR